MAAGARPGFDLAAPADGLQLFHASPVLVRAGEPVQIPVDVVCVTGEAAPCSAAVTVRAAPRGVAWMRATAISNGPPVSFDLAGVSALAVDHAAEGSVSYVLEADDELGRQAMVPERGTDAPLAFYVTRDLPVLAISRADAGPPPRSEEVLALPWGTGTLRAGLAPGVEALTIGPSSFDVDAAGRVHLLDQLQGRIAVFGPDGLIREVPVSASPEASVVVDGQGRTSVVDRARGWVAVSRFDASGRAVDSDLLGMGIPGRVATAGEATFVQMFPGGAWARLGEGQSGTSTGRPVADGRALIALARPRSIRVAAVDQGHVTNAVEVVPGDQEVSFGELALAEVAGDRYVLVVRTIRSGAGDPIARFRVIGIEDANLAWSFQVMAEDVIDVRPLSRFRLGRDGHLYQLIGSPDGLRIVRFDLPEEASS
jgi:hypothetical protein